MPVLGPGRRYWGRSYILDPPPTLRRGPGISTTLSVVVRFQRVPVVALVCGWPNRVWFSERPSMELLFYFLFFIPVLCVLCRLGFSPDEYTYR